MNPSNKESSGLVSTLPLPEQPAGGDGAATAEQPAGAGERTPMPAMTPPMAVPSTSATAVPLPNPVPAGPLPSGSAATQNSALPADDGDLIEKEWVAKAKQIVERTRDDPYKQSEDLTLFKADYMKKRYGKTIKVSR